MKKLLFVMSISLLTLSAPAQNKKNETDLAAHNLKGNVKSINEITYETPSDISNKIVLKKVFHIPTWYGSNR